MPALTCYRLKREVDGKPDPDFDDYISDEDGRLIPVGPATYPDFEVKLNSTASPARVPLWGGFLAEGMQEAIAWPAGRSASAIALVRVLDQNRRQYFAFTFGPAARFFLRNDVHSRAYGLKTALNLMYPAGDAPSRLPFFSKVNLRRSVRDLESRGYGVTLLPVSVRV